MRRARPNPALTERQIFALRDRIYTAVEDGLRELIEKKTLAKIFRPVPPETVGTVEQEMELLRLVTGDWKRTGKPYEACNFTMPQYLAFAYCAERALLASGNTEMASVFSFIRSAKDPKRVVAGYPSHGGLSRILQWYRDHGALGTGDSLKHNVHCDSKMLEFSTPDDCIRFSRSEIFGIGKWRDNWRVMDESVRSAFSKFAWREAETRFLIDEKMFVGGVSVGDIHTKNKNLDNYDMTGMSGGRVVFEECSMNGCVVNGSFCSLDIKNTELHRAIIIVNCEENVTISGCNGREMIIKDSVCDFFDVSSSRMISLSVNNIRKNGYGSANFVDSILTDSSIEACVFNHFDFTDCVMTDSNFSKNKATSEDYGFMFDGCRLDRLKSSSNNSRVGYSFKTCRSTGLRSKIKGWKVVGGMIVKDESAS